MANILIRARQRPTFCHPFHIEFKPDSSRIPPLPIKPKHPLSAQGAKVRACSFQQPCEQIVKAFVRFWWVSKHQKMRHVGVVLAVEAMSARVTSVTTTKLNWGFTMAAASLSWGLCVQAHHWLDAENFKRLFLLGPSTITMHRNGDCPFQSVLVELENWMARVVQPVTFPKWR